jgi:hypothetical protein
MPRNYHSTVANAVVGHTEQGSGGDMQPPKVLPAFFAFLALSSTGRAPLAQELSAEQVSTDSAGHTFKSKAYMGHGKVRGEPLEALQPGSGAPELADYPAGS